MWEQLLRLTNGAENGTRRADWRTANRRKNPRLGLALGGGAARGWAHIGVMRVLLREGFQPHVIAGTSIGAVVGGCYAAGKLEALESFAHSLTRSRIVGLLDPHLNGPGLIAGEKLRKQLEEHLGDFRIEDLDVRFTAVATEMGTGHEIWLSRGPLIEAMRASYALPGILDAINIGGRWLMDGALVNPIPVSVPRAAGCDIVIAVNVNGDLFGRGSVMPGTHEPMSPSPEPPASETLTENMPPAPAEAALIAADAPATTRMPFTMPDIPAFIRDVSQKIEQWQEQDAQRPPPPPRPPALASVLMDAFNITQDRIARSRLAGDPPDLVIAPRLARIGLFDFDRAKEVIELGEQAAERVLPELRDMIEAETADRDA